MKFKTKWDQAGFDPIIYVFGVMLTNHTTRCKVQFFLIIDGYYVNCTKTFISVIARNILIAHNPSQKIYMQCYNCNNLFMHKGQDRVNIVEVYMLSVSLFASPH